MAFNRKDILELIEQLLRERVDASVLANKGLNEDLSSASKSSAGDKHETGRAMIHLEQEKMGKQLAMAKKDLQLFQSLKDHTSPTSSAGSIVVSSGPVFFLGVSIGKLSIESQALYGISMLAPIAKQLVGLKIGDSIHFQGKQLDIVEIL